MTNRSTLLGLCLLLACTTTWAQQGDVEVTEVEEPQTRVLVTEIDEGNDRLFQSFIQDAAVVSEQWWEGQLVFTDFDVVDSAVGRLVFALHPYEDWEFGGTVGFGNSDTPPAFPDGSGATDLDLFGKWRVGEIGKSGKSDLALGAVITIPTGDDAVGLGFDAFALELFGALRTHFNGWDLVSHVGFQFNGNGQFVGTSLDGDLAAQIGAGGVWPVSSKISVIGELNLGSGRFDGFDSDLRVYGGINWAVARRGLFRAALGIGLTDGAPDTQLTAGYAWVF